MKAKVEQFAKGIFTYTLPDIILSESSVEIYVEEGRQYLGSLKIKNSEGIPMKGLVYSSNHLLCLKEDKFFEPENTICYEMNASGLSAGEEFQCEIQIVSDCGEVFIPVHALIEAPNSMTSLGKMKDLFQFTNLAKEDWMEAIKLFKSGDFERVFFYKDPLNQMLYRNLVKSVSASQALEEFLIAIHKKLPIHLSVDKTNISHTAGSESFMDKIVLTKDNWGYMEMKISTDASFIALEHKIVWADNFIGNHYNLEFVVNTEFMRDGKNYGRIYIKTIYETISIEIECSCIKDTRSRTENYLSIKKYQTRLMQNYLDFRTNHIALEKYITDSEQILQDLSIMKGDIKYELLRTHLAMMNNQDGRAERMLGSLKEKAEQIKEDSIVNYCGYLYLISLFHKDDSITKQAVNEMRTFYENGEDNFFILWFLLYLDTKYDNHVFRITSIKKKIQEGCHSPVLYYEAVAAFNREPSYLHELGAFEIQIMDFGIRRDCLSKETAIQYTYLVAREKQFNSTIFRNLVKLYRKYKSKDILTSICTLLIKGEKSSKEYFPWFSLGVEAQLKITQLYEYYMYSVDETVEQPLAQGVLLYFIYNSSLSDSRKAYLYASIIRNKEKNASIYRTYLKQIESFCFRQIAQRNISRNLAVIYHEILREEMISDKLAVPLSYLIFKYELRCMNPNIKGVYIAHKEMKAPSYVPLTNGEAQIYIYTDNAQIFLADYNDNRYNLTMDYSLHQFMPDEQYLTACARYAKDNPMVLLALSEKNINYQNPEEDFGELSRCILQIPDISQEYICRHQTALIYWLYDHYEGEILEAYLSTIDLRYMQKPERCKLIEFMIIGRMYERVMVCLKQHGYDGIPVKRILKLCSNKIAEEQESEKDDSLLDLCHYVFCEGKYNDDVLKYLTNYYSGTTKNMFELWKAAKESGIDTMDLEDRLLGQILFAQSYVTDAFSVFSSYYEKGSSRKLIRAFLSFYAYRYLIHDGVVQPEFFNIIKKELSFEKNDTALLALLKYDSNQSELSSEECEFADFHLHEFIDREIILPFFKNFGEKINLPWFVCDKYYVEYVADPKKNIKIHYRLPGGKDADNFMEEPMKNVYMGIHVKEFILFYNEELQYYITEESDGQEVITESLNITIDSNIEEVESKYNNINMMLMTSEMKDEKTLLLMMENYIKRDCLVDELFQML